AIAFGPSGVRPSDITHALSRSPVARGVAIFVWMLVVVPIVRAALVAPSSFFLRAMPFSIVSFAVIHGSFAFAAQIAWGALWAIGEGVVHGVASTVVAAALAALIVARPRCLSDRAMLIVVAIAFVATPWPLLWFVVAAPVGVLAV